MLGAHNPLLKSVRKAVHRGSRTEDGYAIAEGFHMLEEAVGAGLGIGAVLATPRAAERVRWSGAVQVVEEAVFHQISTVENSQGVLALVRLEERTLEECLSGTALVVALDGVQDPGNAGAMVRSAEAFGATGVVFLKGTVSPWNPKTLRGSAGSLLRVPFGVSEWEPFLAEIERRRIGLFAASPRGEMRVDEVRFDGPSALLIGNEGKGVPAEHAEKATAVRIPTEKVESLNAALAAGILLYEARRQRA